MRVVDMEQERMEQEKTPEGKRKKLLQNIATILAVAVFVAVMYLVYHHPFFVGQPHMVLVDGVTIVPGETTMEELNKEGYELSDWDHSEMVKENGKMQHIYTEVLDLSTQIEPRTYYSMVLVKEGLGYATVEFVNESSSSVPITACKIRAVTVADYHEASQNAQLEGILFDELTVDALSAASGLETEELNETYYTWEKGNYLMRLEFRENGTVESFTSGYEKQ